MTQKKQNQSKPSAADIYASAWAALEAEHRVYSEAELGAEGWKSSYSFPKNTSASIYCRLLRDPNVERKSFKVTRGGQARSVTFFRPRV